MGTHLRHMIMPVLTLSAYYFGAFSIVYRAEYQAVMQRPVHPGRPRQGIERVARGVPSRGAERDPARDYLSRDFASASLTGGAVVTETIFSMPGIGRLFVSSIESRDFPVMLAVGMLIVVGVVLMNLLADIGYGIVNPQIRDPS